jgi:hypothetical protein
LNSALLELFEFIRSENIKSLIAHFGKDFNEVFQVRPAAIALMRSAAVSDLFSGNQLRWHFQGAAAEV